MERRSLVILWAGHNKLCIRNRKETHRIEPWVSTIRFLRVMRIGCERVRGKGTDGAGGQCNGCPKHTLICFE